MNDSFSALHPALTFCYFAAVLLLTMLVLHPVFLALSLLGALGYCAVLRGWRSLGRTLGWLVPFLVLMAALNALLNHAGVTMLFYLPNGNPVTREALCYGAAAAAMFAAVILWFQCCNVVMTAEKYLYVFGSALPGVSLLLSMALRFVPKFSAHIRSVRAAQASLGCGTREGSAWQRLKNGARILSVTVSWALESGITAADSMKSRGYGAGRRTYFGNYRFTRRDGVLSAVLALALAGVCAGVGCGALTVLIRVFGGFPEGVSFAILIMNCCAWMFDKHTQRRQFGVSREDVKAKKAAAKAAKKEAKEAAANG